MTEQLADQLALSYDLLPLAELSKDDPGRAQEHWSAAHDLRGWLRRLPKDEEKAAFQRGWDRAMDRAKLRISELETALASQPQDNGQAPPTVESGRQRARQDPRYAVVRRELAGLDAVDGQMVIPYPLQELLALRLIAALQAADLPGGPHTTATP